MDRRTLNTPGAVICAVLLLTSCGAPPHATRSPGVRPPEVLRRGLYELVEAMGAEFDRVTDEGYRRAVRRDSDEVRVDPDESVTRMRAAGRGAASSIAGRLEGESGCGEVEIRLDVSNDSLAYRHHSNAPEEGERDRLVSVGLQYELYDVEYRDFPRSSLTMGAWIVGQGCPQEDWGHYEDRTNGCSWHRDCVFIGLLPGS